MYYLVRERGLGMRICREKKRMSKEIENEEEKQRKN